MAMTDPQATSTTSTTTTSNNGIIHKRMPTLRPFTLPVKEGSVRTKSLEDRTKDMNDLFSTGSTLSQEECDDILHSLQNVCPTATATSSSPSSSIDFDKLRSTLIEIAHLSHKDWSVTEANSKVLGEVLFPPQEEQEGGRIETPMARQILERILIEGNWDGAAEHAQKIMATSPSDDNDGNNNNNPWTVLVTGVNGIRKTTSIYQQWWPQLLQEALICPATTSAETTGKRKSMEEFPLDRLPAGSNSFFRQLDHMIATLCNEDFKALYYLTEQEILSSSSSLSSQQKKNDISSSTPPSPEIVKKYSDLKAAIFTRYRTLSELLGALLLQEAQKKKSNCMMETSGRDVAMFHYVDHFFPVNYNKLALHFTINDLSLAQESVDRRMVQEIQAGIQAVDARNDFSIIYANAGGPYGSEVLPGVQEASDRVWNEVVLKGKEVGQDWYKATIAIQAHPKKPWTARAVRPDGSLGTMFTFANKQ